MTSNREARSLGYTNRLHYKYGDAFASSGGFYSYSSTDYSKYPKESYFKSRYGYNVHKATTVETRRIKLAEAIRCEGYNPVVNYLKLMIEINTAIGRPRMRDSIARWKDDLNWVFSTYPMHDKLLVKYKIGVYKNGVVKLKRHEFKDVEESMKFHNELYIEIMEREIKNMEKPIKEKASELRKLIKER